MGVTSRAPSADLRAGSVARDIAKRRNKPYKTEISRVVAKKKKLNLYTTYTDPPPGFTYLPFGTQDLADRCKELSRLRGLPVHIVNAQTFGHYARHPEKVSHHIHRVGYHFRSEVVDDACRELGYEEFRGRFAKPDEIRAQYQHSVMARTMARHGIRMDSETSDQIRAAIRELFPRIPEDDLKEIIKHAWKKGSGRVGTNPELDLPSRAQLAVIARIRHAYTDYDTLLKPFGWEYARATVEPVCLAKLIEWRGENDQQDDNEFEEFVRETIVIDDDDDPHNGSEANDEDSAGPGYNSDTRMEISHRPAEDADLAAESHDEEFRSLLDHHRQSPRHPSRYVDVSQKLGAVREQMRNGTLVTRPPPPGQVIKIQMPENGDTVQINGKTYRRAAPTTPIQFQPVPRGVYGFQQEQPLQPRVSQSYPRPHNPADNRALQDRPIASIEPHDDLRRVALSSHSGHRLCPVTPSEERASQRRRSEHGPSATRTRESPIVIDSDFSEPKRFAYMIDLTADSPQRQYSDRAPVAPNDPHSSQGRPIMQSVSNGGHHDYGHTSVHTQSPQHDPQRPLLAPGYGKDHSRSLASWLDKSSRSGPVDSQVAPIQYMPRIPLPTVYMSLRHPAVLAAQQPKTFYVPPPPPPPSYTPQPVHGAPAAVQQLPRPFGQSQTGVTYPQNQAVPHPPPTAVFTTRRQRYFNPR